MVAVLGIMLACSTCVLMAQELPTPSERPLQPDVSIDPILDLKNRSADREVFKSAVTAAVRRHPQLLEMNALKNVAEASRDEAIERRLPSIDINISSYRTISREFSNDPENIIERSRPDQRTDAIYSVSAPILDFGAGAARVAAATARIVGAEADVQSVSGQIALNSIVTYYEIFSYRALISVTRAFINTEKDLRSAMEARIDSGFAAEGDIARVVIAESRAQTRLARFERLLSVAEARFTELTGLPVPHSLERSPGPEKLPTTRDEASDAAVATPAVRAAEAEAAAVGKLAKAQESERLPQVTAGIDAGRYGVFENERDYDIRARVTARWTLFGGVEPRIRQAEARAVAAGARAVRIREQAIRESAIAWADVGSLEMQLEVREAAYIASRQTRDITVARFEARRGTAFDVAAAEEAFFESASAYIEALTELDTSRYILLFRTGRLLQSLDIDSELLENNFE